MTADRPATEPPPHRHAFTCAYCTGDGIDRPDFVDREDFEAHMEHLHHGLPFEFPRAEAAQGAAPRAEGPQVLTRPLQTVRFDLDDEFWQDWWRNWFLFGTVYAINNPEPRVVDAPDLIVHDGPCERAAPRAEGLDVEPLIRLVRLFDGDYNRADLDLAVNEARAAIDAARLSRPSDEVKP